MTINTFKGEISDITGMKFGRLTAAERIQIKGKNGKTISLWKCICECGESVSVRLGNLRSGNTQSCGCLHRESMAERRKTKAIHKSEYATWNSMKGRCNNKNNPSFHRYGGRGIRVCERWQRSFEDFFSDVGEKPSPQHQLDRIDNDGNYEPGNVRWATPAEQSRNRRSTINVTINGKTQCLGDWSAELGLSRDMVEQRIRVLGWSPIKALTTPHRKNRTHAGDSAPPQTGATKR